MKIQKQSFKNSALAAIVLESNQQPPVQGLPPTEEEIIAWAEGRLSGEQESKIMHWVANDDWSHSCFQDYLEYADVDIQINPDAASDAAEASVTPTTLLENIVTLWATLFSARRAVAVMAGIAALTILVFQLLPSKVPLGLTDYAHLTSDPAENWRYLAAIDASTRGTTTPKLTSEKTALLFGVRTSLLELKLNEQKQVKAYFNSLPITYPICEQTDNLCEQLNNWYYKLGQWTVLTERTCNTRLNVADQRALLDSQQKGLAALRKTIATHTLPVAEALQVVLVESNTDNICRIPDAVHSWSAS